MTGCFKSAACALLMAGSLALADTQAPAPGKTVSVEMDHEIRRFLVETGQARLLDQIQTDLMGQLTKNRAKLSEKQWSKLRAETNPAEAVNRIVPIYASYFTLDELKAANAFYATLTGQHILQALPQANIQARQTSEIWGQQVLQHLNLALAEQAKPTGNPTH
jgi:hypothetical protein